MRRAIVYTALLPLVLVLAPACGSRRAGSFEAGPKGHLTQAQVPCTLTQLSSPYTDTGLGLSLTPTSSDSLPSISADQACSAAARRGGADATSAMEELAYLTWTSFGNMTGTPLNGTLVSVLVSYGACAPDLP